MKKAQNSADPPIQTTLSAVIVLCEPERAATHGQETHDAVRSWLTHAGFACADAKIVPFDPAALRKACRAALAKAELLVVCGGTGIGAHDIAPPVLEQLCDFRIPGIGELLRAESLRFSLSSPLSRCGGYVAGGRLVISIPGSAKAALEQLEILKDILPRAISALKGRCASRSIQP